MNFRAGDRVIYINKIYHNEIGTVFDSIPGQLIVSFDNDLIGVIPINPENVRLLTKLEKAL